MTAFADNHQALQQDTNAASAIKELTAIRNKPVPYGQINRIDPLLSTVETVNERLAAVERKNALLAIEQKLTEVETALDQVQTDTNLRNKALRPMQQLKVGVAGLSSIPQIRYLAEQAGILLDNAMDLIASAQKPTAVGIKEPGERIDADAKPVTVTVMPIAVVSASKYSVKSYLENEGDVETYPAKLKDELLTNIRLGKQIRIQ